MTAIRRSFVGCLIVFCSGLLAGCNLFGSAVDCPPGSEAQCGPDAGADAGSPGDASLDTSEWRDTLVRNDTDETTVQDADDGTGGDGTVDVASDTGMEDTSDPDTGGGEEGPTRLEHLVDSPKCIKTVQPGNLASALDQLPGDGDRPVPYSLLRLEPGEVYTPDQPLELERGQQLHAVGATIRPDHEGTVFQMNRESKIYGGTIELGSGGNTAFKLQETRFSFPGGPQGTKVTADPGTGAQGLRVDFPGGKLDYVRAFLETDGVDFPVVFWPMNPDKFTFYNSNDLQLKARDYEIAVRLIGANKVRHNRFILDLTPTDRAEQAIWMDNPTLQGNWLEGRFRNPNTHAPLVEIRQSAVDTFVGPINVVAPYSGRTFDSPPQWKDVSGDGSGHETNRMTDFSEASLSYGTGIGTDDDRKKEVLCADGSNFEARLQQAASDGADVRLESGTDFEITNVTIPADVAVDARGTRFELNDGDGFRFEEGATLIGGRVMATTSGTVMTVRAAGTTIEQPTGPVQTMVQGNSNPRGMTVAATDGGKVTGLENSMHALGLDEGFDFEASKNGTIADNKLYLVAASTPGAFLLRMHGDGTIRDNAILGHLQPSEGLTGVGWLIDGPNVANNRVDGWIWDHHKAAGPGVRVTSSGGGNIYTNYLSQTIDFQNKYQQFENQTNSDDTMIGYDEIDEYPDVRQRVAEDRLAPSSFSVFSLEE